ncbi:high-affinity choline transporter 1-like [Ixodes scapularis]|uniref:high-affinity choline transporter 1-like n=1 Tax=Ixodes scapularis TaxID=6945 RepID=UPI001C3860B5|nr:high-affinity choline transporter 1-like [Ixodes scapularis]
MAINTLAAVCIIFYYIAILFVGVWAGRKVHADKILAQARGVHRDKKSRKEENSVDNFLLRFFVANRCLPLTIGFASMTATWAGGGFINRTAEVIYTKGLVYCNVPLGYMASLCIGGWLFAGKMRATDSLTMLDPFQKHYGCWMGVLLSVPAVSGELCWTASILYALDNCTFKYKHNEQYFR